MTELIKELMALNEEKVKLPEGGAGTPEFDEMMDAFIDYAESQDFNETARESDPDQGTEYLMDKFEDWLRDQGVSYSRMEAFMDKHEDDIFDFIYNGLT